MTLAATAANLLTEWSAIPIRSRWRLRRLTTLRPSSFTSATGSRADFRETFLYTQSHFWLEEVEAAGNGKAPLYKVGFTRFATRMLGEIVEQGFEAKPGSRISVGQTLGWVEGFKALSDVYGVLDGVFEGSNSALNDDPSRIDKDPYYSGWLYLARGTPEPNSTAVEGYMQVLDATIDKMLG